jgi:hypothetical protein
MAFFREQGGNIDYGSFNPTGEIKSRGKDCDMLAF